MVVALVRYLFLGLFVMTFVAAARLFCLSMQALLAPTFLSRLDFMVC